MKKMEAIILILITGALIALLIWASNNSDSDPIICPVCLGDGMDEGWSTANKCKACGGDGKYHNNKLSDMEILKDKAQRELTRRQDEVDSSKSPEVYLKRRKKFQKWINEQQGKLLK